MIHICIDCSKMAAAVEAWALEGRVGNSPPAPPRTPRPVVGNSNNRCTTHWRIERQRRKDAAHEKRVQKVYGLPPGGYQKLYEFQGERCAICRWATGASRRLSVDHDHRTGRARGLLCRPCNDFLGYIRDDLAAAERVARYLSTPPAHLLGLEAVHEENR